MLNYKYASLALSCTLVVIYVSSIPDPALWGDGSSSDHIISNLAHIPAYALLTFLWLKCFERKKNRERLFTVNSFILVGLVFFAISDEIHQSFVPERSACYMDIGLDLLGILFGLVTFKISRTVSLFQEK